jgi:sugar-specific transcriptional regulator TrmB
LQEARSVLSQQKILKTLVSIGLTQWDAKVYVLLAKRGPIRARDAAEALKISKQRLYPIIRSLQRKGIVNSSLERPARFSAEPFEKVLDLFVKAKMAEAHRVQQNKDAILEDWQSIAVAEGDSSSAKFTVIEGRNYVYSKIQQMIQETKSHLAFVATVPSLTRADQYGLFDAAFHNPLKSKIRFRFLTEISGQNAYAVKMLLKRRPKGGLNLEGKTPDLGLELCPRMIIRDKEETVFFIDDRKSDFATERDDVCLWTNCRSLVQAFLTMFEDLWGNAMDIDKKLVEIETDKPAPKTCIINDSQAAKNKYEETLRKAVKEILIMTSSRGLIEFWRNKRLLKECTSRSVSVKIMAPIIGENLNVALQLSECCEIRHVAPGYLGTAIIDGHYLFQFKNPPPAKKNMRNLSSYQNTFYTDDFEYVEKAKNMLEDVWKKAHKPSALTIESIIKQASGMSTSPKARKMDTKKRLSELKHVTVISDTEASKTLTEKQVLHKALSAEKIRAKDLLKEFSRMFCTWAWAVIYPPKVCSLPKLMITAVHIEKQSSLGAEDTLHVSLWLNTPTGYGFVPVAFVHDRPDTAALWKRNYIGTPAEHNIQTVKKDEIQVRVHGNTLFAGWTVPISLWPPHYSIPPACLLFEGYGEARPGKGTMRTGAGITNKMEFNCIDAFVTFMHPESKYEGCGTEGILLRDCVIDSYPQ